MRASVILPPAFVALMSAGPAPQSQVDDAAKIRAARAEQNQAIAARNFDRVASFWSDNVLVTAGLGFTLRGSDAYRRAFLADSAMVYERDLETVQVNARWPIAWETGSWTGRLVGHSGAPVLGGRYAAQWIKDGGQWRIRSELFVALQCSGVGCAWPPRPE